MVRNQLYLVASALTLWACGERSGPATVLPAAPAPSSAPSIAASPSVSAAPTPPTPSASSSAPPARPEVHADAGKVVSLPVPGFGDAVVAIAAAGVDPRPVVIAAHANWDRPSWECDWWKRLLKDAFILCPRGIVRRDSPAPDDLRFTYENDKVLEAEVDAGIAALERRFPGRVQPGKPMLWVGLSRGAFLGARIAARHPKRFPRLILVEGGHDPWTPANAKAYAEGGGKRILFVCGQGACTVLAKRAAKRLEHYGVATRLENVPGMGHGLSGDADAPILQAMPWLEISVDGGEP